MSIVASKKRLDDKDVAFAILSHLVRSREDRMPKITAHSISKKAPEFRTSTQRPQRVRDMLINMEQNGLVRREKLSGGTYWEVTESGVVFYKTIAKAYMNLF